MIEPELGNVDASPVPSLGEVLRNAREGKQVSLEEIALRVNIPLKHLQALENQEFDKLPGLPFAKGYLRSYAKALGLNPDGLVAQLVREAGNVQPDASVASISKVGQQVQVGHPLMRFSLIVFVVALLGVSVWWWQTQSSIVLPGNSELSNEPTQELAANDAASIAEVDEAPVNATDIQARLAAKREEMANIEQAFSELNAPSTLSENSEQPAIIESTETEEPVYLSEQEIAELANQLEPAEALPSEIEQTLPANEQEAPAETVQVTPEQIPTVEVAKAQKGLLEVTFSGDCWVSIRDGSDKLVFANTKKAGESLSLRLDLPASVLIGKVSSVSQANFNGESLDLASQARKDVAKITLAAN